MPHWSGSRHDHPHAHRSGLHLGYRQECVGDGPVPLAEAARRAGGARKPQNMALNSAVMAGSGENGRAQTLHCHGSFEIAALAGACQYCMANHIDINMGLKT